MNVIINVLLLIIIFVFDPLAISLVIAANFMFNQLKDKDEDLDESETHDDVSKRAGKIEKDLINTEPKPLDVSDELLSRLEKELSKIETKDTKNEKSMVIN